MARAQYEDVVINQSGRPQENVPVSITVFPGAAGSNTIFNSESGEGTIENVVTNRDGVFSVWLEEGRYTISAGAVTKVVDIINQTNITSLIQAGLVYSATSHGIILDGETDNAKRLQELVSEVPAGAVVFFTPGICVLSKSVVLPPTIGLWGSHGDMLEGTGFTATKSYLQATKTFEGNALIEMVDKQTGGYEKDSCEQRLFYLTLDGSKLEAGNTVDGLRATGLVHGVKTRDLCIRKFGGHGFQPVEFTRSGSEKVHPYSWRILNSTAIENGSHGWSFAQMTDSTFEDVQAFGNTKSGYFISGGSNSQYRGLRAEWNSEYGYLIEPGGNFGAMMFHGITTDRNTKDGVHITGTGTQPILFSGLNLKRDGRNNKTGEGGLAGFNVTKCTAPVHVDGIQVSGGVDDTGEGVSSPEYGASVTESSYVCFEGAGTLHGKVEGLHEGGGNGIIRKGANVRERTGEWNNPVGPENENGALWAREKLSPEQPFIQMTSAEGGSTDALFKSFVKGLANSLYETYANGKMEWGSGSAGKDTILERTEAKTLKLTNTLVLGENLRLNVSSAAGGKGVIALNNASVTPTENPSGGGIIFCKEGQLWFKGSSGTETKLAAA